MFWTAGQERITREGRERLASLYAGVRDGYMAAEVAVGRVKWVGGDGTPAYARPDPEQRRATAKHGLAQLMADFPSFVTQGTEMVN